MRRIVGAAPATAGGNPQNRPARRSTPQTAAHDQHEHPETESHQTPDQLLQDGGASLMHPDLNRGNMLIGNSQSVLVDWALPGQGAAWINLAFFAFFLMNEGWQPAQAERWVNRFRAWREADPCAIRTFITALTRRRSEQASSAPPLRRMERLRQESLALEWLQHCG
ncbi:phosphotransferase [Streptomyces sp. NPDC057963]|uniref:phosphotransferase n=1 Tax=Streptomyces sp. NPDC057963 TaxID=3346290 RepID=UPI0036E53270